MSRWLRQVVRLGLGLLMWGMLGQVWAAHAYAQFGDIKYPPGFKHFDYVDPQAPKRGDFSLVAPLIAAALTSTTPSRSRARRPQA